MSRKGSQRSSGDRAATPAEGQWPAPADEEARRAMAAQGQAGTPLPEQIMAYAQQMMQMALGGSGSGGFPPQAGFGFGGQYPGFPRWALRAPQWEECLPSEGALEE